VYLGERLVGLMGELHPRLQQEAELPKPAVLFELDLGPLLEREVPRMREIARHQPLQRDIALVLGEQVAYAAVEAAIGDRSRRDDRLSALADVRLFDVYRPRAGSEAAAGVAANTLLNKEKSLAIRIVLQDTERPLSDTDADAAVAAIVEELTARFNARLRQ
jgi:phenylalanyl-tRNA synthetase beta chain